MMQARLSDSTVVVSPRRPGKGAEYNVYQNVETGLEPMRERCLI